MDIAEASGASRRRPLFWKIRLRLLGAFRSFMLRIICLSWRKRIQGLDTLDNLIANGQKMILVFWHGKYFSLLPLLKGRRACVFTSESSRGDVISDILRRFGYIGIQVPDHGREHSLGIMREALSSSGLPAGITVDGPLGPYHVVHRGAVQLASELGYLIVPVSVASRRKRVLSWRWDKMELPRMWTRIALVIGEAFSVPENLSTDQLQDWIERVKDEIEQVDKLAEDNLTSY